jgi:hypothetical protein
MATIERRTGGMSRRELLGAGLRVVSLAGVGLTVVPALARAQQKMAQKLVQYQDTPKNNQKCSDCLHFIAPDQCKLVEGKIKPNGWCALFAPKPKPK